MRQNLTLLLSFLPLFRNSLRLESLDASLMATPPLTVQYLQTRSRISEKSGKKRRFLFHATNSALSFSRYREPARQPGHNEGSKLPYNRLTGRFYFRPASSHMLRCSHSENWNSQFASRCTVSGHTIYLGVRNQCFSAAQCAHPPLKCPIPSLCL
jgi:hypothetical protein